MVVFDLGAMDVIIRRWIRGRQVLAVEIPSVKVSERFTSETSRRGKSHETNFQFLLVGRLELFSHWQLDHRD